MAQAKREGSELLLVHVIEPRGPALGRGYRSLATFEAIMRREATTRLDAMVARARRAGVRARALVVSGRAPEAIVKAARKARAGLIVLGTHGRSGLPRILLGSVADRVVQLAACPVMTVHGPGGRRAT